MDFTSFEYDGFQRQSAKVQAKIGRTSFEYDNLHRVIRTSFTPVNSSESQVSESTYNSAGQVVSQTLPGARHIYRSYGPQGELLLEYDDGVTPVAYGYEQGRRVSLTTWKDFANRTGEAVTRWVYDPHLLRN